MNEHPDNIKRELRGMTEWEGKTPRLWERAVERVEQEGDAPVAKIRPWYAQQWVYAAASVAAILVISAGILAPQLGRSRASSVSPSMAPDIDLQSVLGSSQGGGGGESPFRSRAGAPGFAERERQPPPTTEPDAARAVVRKATMEITTPDVRAAAVKAQQLLSEPGGEYVESADIDDSNKDRPRADLVLRVEATRLEEVLTQLRELGEVSTERIDGEDVTDQMVDLGARLENERRVEQELLELLEARENDDLDDILAVRRELNNTRERIERLAAQQDHLARMVQLARVAVMFRTLVVEPEPEPKEGVWSRFIDDLGTAWTDGLATLLGTIAGLVRVLVGGAIPFVIAGVAAALAWRSWRLHHPRALAE